MTNETDWAQEYRITAEKWVDLEAAADLLEQTKSSVLAERMAMLGDMPVSRAENMVKATPEWRDHVEEIVNARKAANLARVEMEFARMRFQQQQSSEATARAEARLY